MESWRPRSPETSSSDEDRNPNHDHDSGTTTAKRSYECTFCKRGFTNAQALGGHMNIHRKDRAKAKQLCITGTNYNNSTSSSINSNNYHYSSEDHHHHHYVSMSYDQREPISSQGASGYYPVLDQSNYQMYFQPSDDSSLGSRSNESLGMNQELWGANLSLNFSPNHLENDGYGRGVRRSDDVDLELRLGHA